MGFGNDASDALHKGPKQPMGTNVYLTQIQKMQWCTNCKFSRSRTIAWQYSYI